MPRPRKPAKPAKKPRVSEGRTGAAAELSLLRDEVRSVGGTVRSLEKNRLAARASRSSPR